MSNITAAEYQINEVIKNINHIYGIKMDWHRNGVYPKYGEMMGKFLWEDRGTEYVWYKTFSYPRVGGRAEQDSYVITALTKEVCQAIEDRRKGKPGKREGVRDTRNIRNRMNGKILLLCH